MGSGVVRSVGKEEGFDISVPVGAREAEGFVLGDSVGTIGVGVAADESEDSGATSGIAMVCVSLQSLDSPVKK